MFGYLSYFRDAHTDRPGSDTQSGIGSEVVHGQDTNPTGIGSGNTRLLATGSGFFTGILWILRFHFVLLFSLCFIIKFDAKTR